VDTIRNVVIRLSKCAAYHRPTSECWSSVRATEAADYRNRICRLVSVHLKKPTDNSCSLQGRAAQFLKRCFNFYPTFLILQKIAGSWGQHAVWVCVRITPFQILNLLTDFHKVHYENYAIQGHTKDVLFRFKVLTAVKMSMLVFWVNAVWIVDKYQRFGGTYCLHLQP
jgi:hypothetical protein